MATRRAAVTAALTLANRDGHDVVADVIQYIVDAARALAPEDENVSRKVEATQR